MNDSDERGALPLGWAATTLGRVLEDIQPGFASGKHTSDGVGLPHLRPMNVTRDGLIDRSELRSVAPELADRPARRLRRGDVLFNNTNSLELVGKTALFNDDDAPAFSNHMTRLRVRERIAESAFVAHLLHGGWRSGHFQRLANNHVSQASISRGTLIDLAIALPPIAEQRRIAARLQNVETRRAATAARLQATRVVVERLRNTVLGAACSGRLTEGWRRAHPDATADELRAHLLEAGRSAKRRRTGEAREHGLTLEAQRELLPPAWGVVRLGDILDIGTGATPLRKNRAYYDEGTIPWVTSGAVNAGTITRPTELITPLALEETNVKLFPPGTLLVAMYGEGQTRGRVAELAIEAGTNQAVAAALFSEPTEALRPFIRLFLEDSYRRTRALSVGGVQPNLNLGMIKDTLIPLPSLAEQHEIVRQTSTALGMADRLAAQIDRAAAALGRASRASMAKAFRGQLVPTEAALAQDEGRDFESADQLLERVGATQPL